MMPVLQSKSIYIKLTFTTLLLFILQMNNYKTAKEAAGIFSQNVQQPIFLSADRHPVRKMMTGHSKKREMILLNHAQVEGIILVTKNQLRVVRIPFKTFDVDLDPDMETPVIAGTIGVSCTSNAPCQLDLEDITSNFSLVEKRLVSEADVPVGSDLPDEIIAALASSATGLQPDEKPFAVASYPKVLPKLVGIEVLEGNIFSDDVQQEMTDYDEAAEH